jgi:hypothetical protein
MGAAMPALLGPVFGFVLGVAFGWIRAAEAQPRGGGGPRGGLLATALFGALVFAPINAYFVAFAGDWALSYLVDRRSVPSAVLLVLVLVDAAAVPAGFALAGRLARTRSLGAVLVAGAAPAAVALLALLAFARRLRIDATYQQYRLDFGTQPIAGGPLGYAVLWMLGMLAAGFVVTARTLRAPRRTEPPPEAAPRLPRLGSPRP